jgi:sugar lactone lactonase YvrE
MMRTISMGGLGQGRGCRGLAAGAAMVLALAGGGALGTARGQVIITVAGSTEAVGDGGAATEAPLSYSYGVAVDSAGSLYIADANNHRIRKVTAPGVITTVAGTGAAGFSGDGGTATAARLFFPAGVAVDSAGNLYIADTSNSRIRKVTAAGVISTLAGTGSYGSSGDGGAATAAQISYPRGVAVDGAGNLYIADVNGHRIRKVTPAGVISTLAGTGSAGYSGDGGAATAAQLNYPGGVAVDSAGNLYIADSYNFRVRKVTPAGVISTVAGNGTCCYSGDGAAATAARLAYPFGVAVDSAGSLYIADQSNSRIRKVTSAGVISTLAGTGSAGYSGDGGAATAAQLYYPYGVAADSAGNVYIADSSNHRIRKIGAVSLTATACRYEWIEVGNQANRGTVTPGASIRFPDWTPGRSSAMQIFVTNMSGTVQRLSSIDVTGSAFRLTRVPSLPVTLTATQPGVQTDFVMEFSPSSGGVSTGAVLMGGQVFPLTGRAQFAAASGATVVDLPATATARQQPRAGVTLRTAYGVDLAGTVTLAFTPDAVNASDDQTLVFANGARTVNFTIPANGTQAVFNPATANQFSVGTTAGTITVGVILRAGNVNVTPSPAPSAAIRIARSAPAITGVVIANKTATGFEVQVTGLATPREVRQARFRFSGTSLDTTELTADVNTAFTNWYRGTESGLFGSAFKYVQPFSVSQGSVGNITSVTVTLSNSNGDSAAANANF